MFYFLWFKDRKDGNDVKFGLKINKRIIKYCLCKVFVIM